MAPPKKVQAAVKRHRDLVVENLKLAKLYAKQGNYNEAADWYRGAAFHQDVADELEST